MKRSVVNKLLVALVVSILGALPAAASGFNIYEQGAKASGQGVAFVARADDASAAYYNPAAITKLEGTQVQFGFSLVFIGDVEAEIAAGTPLYEPGTYDMEDNTGIPPFFHIVHNFDDSPFAVSASLTAPFGLVTEWGPNFGGRFSARKSDLQTVNLNINGAVDVGGGWSLAAGINYIFADIKDFNRNIFLPSIDVNGAAGLPAGTLSPISPALGEPLTGLVGDGDDWGWNLAAHWRGDEWAFGASYRSAMEPTVEGEVIYRDVPSLDPMVPVWTDELIGIGLPADQAAATAQGLANGIAGALSDTPADGVLNLPDQWAIGFAYLGLENWEFEFNVSFLGWEEFESIRINTDIGVEEIFEEWDDTYAYRLGASYQVAENWQLRGGYYMEENPVPQRRLRPSIPDEDRAGVTFGFGYERDQFSIDAYALYITIDDAEATLADFANDPSVVPALYESSVTLIGVSAEWRF